MWSRALSASWSACRSSGPKVTRRSRCTPGRGAPVVPAGSITPLQAVAFWKRLFEESGVSEPEQSSRYIVAHLLGAKTMENLEPQRLGKCLSREQTEEVWRLCSRRLARVPVQYVIEEWDFRDLTLKMKPPVFIPRPETEELVGLLLTDLQTRPGVAVDPRDPLTKCLEVGCGSGAISLSLLKSLPQLQAIALDRSQDAVDLTRENALRLGLQDRLHIHHIDIMKDDAEAVLSACGRVSALISNPPYLFSQDLTSLEPEISRFEDRAALDGGEDGLTVIKQILSLAPQILFNHGRIYLEVEPRHPPLVRRWVEANGEELRYIETRSDITGRPRFCILQKEESNKN